MTLRALDPAGDRPWLEALWAAALGDTWPPLPAGLDLAHDGLVAEEGGAALGMVAVDPAGSILLLLVDPAHQRRGVGTRLLAAALRRLGDLGAGTVTLGSGGEDYIWPGVPDDLPAAVRFFAARGWRWDNQVIDLVRDLRDYRPPAGVYQRAASAGVTLAVAGEQDLEAVLAFEAATFPSWLRWFERRDSSVLVAQDGRGRLVGSLLFRGPDEGLLFAPMLGPAAGTIGCVGVADAVQGRGVGSAMVAHASELLRQAGVRACHIGWVERRAFYVRVGYAPWRRYLMARRRLEAS
jgi:ribosomal protein S18 acetylase RimI-like enzyme